MIILTFRHSLGGAYAQCFAMFKEIAPLKKKIVTFGAPLVCQDDPSKLKSLAKDTIQIVHEYDVVPRLLGQKSFNYWTKELSDYNHFGMYFWLRKGEFKCVPENHIESSGILSHDLAKVFTTFTDHAMLLYCKKLENAHEKAEKRREDGTELKHNHTTTVTEDNQIREKELQDLLDKNEITKDEYQEKKSILLKVEKQLLLSEKEENQLK